MLGEPEVHEISSDSEPDESGNSSSRSAKPKRNESPWKRSLRQCLDEITAPGQIACFKQYTEFANPGLEIENNAQISLPLSQNDAEAIKSVCRQAPFGHGDKTVVDVSVRNTWELDHTQYKLKNPHWKTFCRKIMFDIATELGMAKLAANPYKLLLYEPGSFFKRHKDTEKEAGMIGTLVICLPSKHEGADVHLSLGSEECTLQTAPTSAYDLTALAWYSDVTHEVKELTSGYRLVLTYKLFQPEGQLLSATQVFAQREQLSSLLSEWQSSHLSTNKLAYRLAHQYTQSSISLQNLKGRDRIVCHALNDICSKTGVYLLLAHVVRSESERMEYRYGYSYTYDEDEEVDDSSTDLERVFSSDGELLATDLSIDEDDLLGIDYESRIPDSTEDEEYTGNEYSGGTSRYHDTAVVIIPKSRLMCLLQPDIGHNPWRDAHPTADPKAVKMVKMVADELENNSGDTKTVNEAVSFMTHALNRHVAYNADAAGILAKWGLTLGSNPILVRVLDANSSLGCVEKVNSVIAEILQKRFDCEEGSVDWNKWLGFITACSATQFERILLRISSQSLSSEVKQSLITWYEAILDQKLENQASWDLGDCTLIIHKLKRRLNDRQWLMEKFLPSVASQGSKDLVLQLLHIIASERDSTFGEKATDFYNLILAKGRSKLLLNPGDMQPGLPTPDTTGASLNIHTYMFNRMIDEGYANEAKEETSKVVDAACARLASTATAWMLNLPSYDLVKSLLLPLAVLLEAYRVPPMPAVRELYEVCLRRVHESLPSDPTGGLYGWAHRPRGCNSPYTGDSQYRGAPQLGGGFQYAVSVRYVGGRRHGGGYCMDCQELDRFLMSPAEQVWQFTAPDPRRRHITGQLPPELYAFDTMKDRTPYTLVV